MITETDQATNRQQERNPHQLLDDGAIAFVDQPSLLGSCFAKSELHQRALQLVMNVSSILVNDASLPTDIEWQLLFTAAFDLSSGNSKIVGRPNPQVYPTSRKTLGLEPVRSAITIEALLILHVAWLSTSSDE